MKHYSLGSLVRAGAWGALVGGAAGFVLGVLLAPEEGQKMRRRLAYQLEHLSDQLGSLVDHLVSPEVRGDARQRGDAVIADARSKAKRIHDEIDALMHEVRSHGTPREPSSTAR